MFRPIAVTATDAFDKELRVTRRRVWRASSGDVAGDGAAFEHGEKGRVVCYEEREALMDLLDAMEDASFGGYVSVVVSDLSFNIDQLSRYAFYSTFSVKHIPSYAYDRRLRFHGLLKRFVSVARYVCDVTTFLVQSGDAKLTSMRTSCLGRFQEVYG